MFSRLLPFIQVWNSDWLLWIYLQKFFNPYKHLCNQYFPTVWQNHGVNRNNFHSFMIPLHLVLEINQLSVISMINVKEIKRCASVVETMEDLKWGKIPHLRTFSYPCKALTSTCNSYPMRRLFDMLSRCPLYLSHGPAALIWSVVHFPLAWNVRYNQ